MMLTHYLLLLCIFQINIASYQSQFSAYVDPIKTTSFVLYNGTEILKVQYLDDGDGFSEIAPYLKDCKTIPIYIFGFTTTLDGVTTQAIIEAYATNASNCLIAVDWAKAAGTSMADYPIATHNVEQIATKIANIFWKAYKKQIFPLNIVELIGWSLGAQMAGMIARLFFLLSGKKIKRIIGLDPAGLDYCCDRVTLLGVPVCYQGLVDTDAEFVIIIHSDGGVLGFGTFLISGHVNVFPNGGHALQPGCETVLPQPGKGSCGHRFCVYFWAYAVISAYTENQFIAVELRGAGVYTGWYKFNRGGTIRVGPETPPTTRGLYYLSTNGASPYSKGLKGIESSPDKLPVPVPVIPDIFPNPMKIMTIAADMVNLTRFVTC